jgi:Zn-dependent peptidase ImmA (M78 family)
LHALEQSRSCWTKHSRLVTAELMIIARQLDPNSADWNPLLTVMAAAAEELGSRLATGVSPVDVGHLANCLDVHCEFVEAERFDAAIGIRDSRVVATLNSRHSEHRQRASLAHELAHMLFWEPNRDRVLPILEYGPWDRQGPRREEQACWVFARTLLLPQRVLTDGGLPKVSLTAPSLAALAVHLEVSPALLAMRLLQDFDWYADCAYREHRRIGERRLVSYNGRGVRDLVTDEELGEVRTALLESDGGQSAGMSRVLEAIGGMYTSHLLSPSAGRWCHWIVFSEVRHCQESFSF